MVNEVFIGGKLGARLISPSGKNYPGDRHYREVKHGIVSLGKARQCDDYVVQITIINDLFDLEGTWVTEVALEEGALRGLLKIVDDAKSQLNADVMDYVLAMADDGDSSQA